jgi:hypothetical protein
MDKTTDYDEAYIMTMLPRTLESQCGHAGEERGWFAEVQRVGTSLVRALKADALHIGKQSTAQPWKTLMVSQIESIAADDIHGRRSG